MLLRFKGKRGKRRLCSPSLSLRSKGRRKKGFFFPSSLARSRSRSKGKKKKNSQRSPSAPLTTVEYASSVDLSILLASLVCACDRASPTAFAKSRLSPEAVDSIPSWTMCPTAQPEADAQATTTEKAAAAKTAAEQAATSLLRAAIVVVGGVDVVEVVGAGVEREEKEEARCDGGGGGAPAVVPVFAFHPSRADLACSRARAAATRAVKVSTAAKAMAICVEWGWGFLEKRSRSSVFGESKRKKFGRCHLALQIPQASNAPSKRPFLLVLFRTRGKHTSHSLGMRV